MILSNRAIQRALDERRLIIDPEPFPRQASVDEPNCPYNTTAVDLRLGPRLAIPEAGSFTYDPSQGGIATFLGKTSAEREIPADGGYTLKPNHFVLGQTLEYIELPLPSEAGQPALAARIEGRSSFSRCGLFVHFTAPTVHANFKGNLTLEMINLGKSSITLFPGQAICQLIVELVLDAPFAVDSQFQGQRTPVGR